MITFKSILKNISRISTVLTKNSKSQRVFCNRFTIEPLGGGGGYTGGDGGNSGCGGGSFNSDACGTNTIGNLGPGTCFIRFIMPTYTAL